MPRKIKPYLQGEFDSLCGIYAIINALYALFPDMTETETDRLFTKILQEVERKQANPLRITWEGTGSTLMQHLATFAADVVTRDRSVTVDVSRPFARGRADLAALVRSLREHASDGGVAIICMREDELHLTVVYKVTGKKFHLFDSGGSECIRIKQCDLRPGKRYRIRASETMLLRKAAGQG